KMASLATRIPVRIFTGELAHTWQSLQARYRDQYPAPPTTEGPEVSSINDAATLSFLEKSRPDHVVVSGTNMVGRKLLAWLDGRRCGTINLHTGISPYVRGGPNCTNWCLAMGWYHLIGNTVMWIDAGVDSGDLIATERTLLDGSE